MHTGTAFNAYHGILIGQSTSNLPPIHPRHPLVPFSPLILCHTYLLFDCSLYDDDKMIRRLAIIGPLAHWPKYVWRKTN